MNKDIQMNKIIVKTLGGLSKEVYIRHFLFGLIFPVLFYSMISNGSKEINVPLGLIALGVVNSLLYPYSRFIYEKAIEYIVGNNVFLLNAIFMLLVKFMTMSFCWSLAIFVAPIGLCYLYYQHTKAQN